MEWIIVPILCFISASIGLLIGCMCRVSSDADKRAGQADGGVVKGEEPINLEHWLVITGRKHGKSLIFIRNFAKLLRNRKKFRWKNYYRAKKLCRSGQQISIGR